MDESFRLKSCPKHYTLDQDKAVAPSETVRTALERLKKAYDLSNVKVEAREDAVEGVYSFTGFSDQLKTSGKGLTKEQSRASAIMEFVERYSWLHFDYANYDGYALKSFNAIKKETTATVEESYFLHNLHELKERDKLTDEIKKIPLKWVKGISLMDHKKFYYPINWHNYIFSSNGLATGNALEEAVLQALCEVIERENVYRFFVEKKPGNDIDPQSIKNPLITRVLKNAKKTGIQLLIKDISLDLGVPTIIVQGTYEAGREHLNYQGCGYGTHPDPEKALIRALSEYFEGFSLLKKREEEVDLDWKKIIPHFPKKNLGFISLYNPEMLSKKKQVVKLQDLPNLSRDDMKDEIESILGILKKHKYNVILIDKTHPSLKVPVVRVFVPGMRSVIRTEIETPTLILSEVYYEGGNTKASQEYLAKYWRRTFFELPTGEIAKQGQIIPKPKKAFKKDYIETLQSSMAINKDALEAVKKYMKMFDNSIKV